MGLCMQCQAESWAWGVLEWVRVTGWGGFMCSLGSPLRKHDFMAVNAHWWNWEQGWAHSSRDFQEFELFLPKAEMPSRTPADLSYSTLKTSAPGRQYWAGQSVLRASCPLQDKWSLFSHSLRYGKYSKGRQCWSVLLGPVLSNWSAPFPVVLLKVAHALIMYACPVDAY